MVAQRHPGLYPVSVSMWDNIRGQTRRDRKTPSSQDEGRRAQDMHKTNAELRESFKGRMSWGCGRDTRQCWRQGQRTGSRMALGLEQGMAGLVGLVSWDMGSTLPPHQSQTCFQRCPLGPMEVHQQSTAEQTPTLS